MIDVNTDIVMILVDGSIITGSGDTFYMWDSSTSKFWRSSVGRSSLKYFEYVLIKIE